MMPTRILTKNETFFFKHAGFSYDHKIESAARGRTRCAVALADAEQRYLEAHRNGEANCVWADDSESAAEMDGAFETCESCRIVDGNGNHLASLHAITNATPEYRRVVRAELALDAFPVGV